MVENQSDCLGSIAARVGCDLLIIINIMVSIVFTALTEGRGGVSTVENQGVYADVPGERAMVQGTGGYGPPGSLDVGLLLWQSGCSEEEGIVILIESRF